MFSHFIGKLLPVGSLAYSALVLGTCPPLAAEIVEQSLTQSAYGPLRVCGTAMHRCHCVCLCQRSLRDRRGSGSTSTRVSIRGLPSLAFRYVHFCSCASACSALLLVKPVQLAVSCCPQVLGSLLVCGSVFVPGGVGRIFCMHTSAHAGVIILSCQRGLVRHLF